MQLGLTPKQIELLTKIRDKNPDGSFALNRTAS